MNKPINTDLPLIAAVKELRETHVPYRPYDNRPLTCSKCSQVDLVTFPCIDVQVYDALIRVYDLGRFMASPVNIAMDVKEAAKELHYAIQYGYNYEAVSNAK